MWGVCSEVQEQILSLEPDTNLAAVADVGRDIKKVIDKRASPEFRVKYAKRSPESNNHT